MKVSITTRKCFLRTAESGATITEYAILLVFVSLVALACASSFDSNSALHVASEMLPDSGGGSWTSRAVRLFGYHPAPADSSDSGSRASDSGSSSAGSANNHSGGHL